MANKIVIKRTTTSGLLPNVSNSSNTSYIAAGELAINLTDRKLLSSNGSATFEVGANLATIVVGTAFTQTSGNANFDSGVLFVDGTNNRVGIGTTSPDETLDVGFGNLTFSVTGQRITGDMTNATLANRLAFQTSTTNSTTTLGILPNGTGQVGELNLFSGSNLANTALFAVLCSAAANEARLISGITGTATYLPMTFLTGGSERMRIDTAGNVGIGTTNPGYKLQVNGSFAATTKSFVINHPTKPDMRLRYGSLEGPENGVYVRGRTKGDTIQLPDYWTGLVDEFSITVNLTPIGSHQKLYVKSIDKNVVTIGGALFDQMEYFYTVFAERKDVDKLIVEI